MIDEDVLRGLLDQAAAAAPAPGRAPESLIEALQAASPRPPARRVTPDRWLLVAAAIVTVVVIGVALLRGGSSREHVSSDSASGGVSPTTVAPPQDQVVDGGSTGGGTASGASGVPASEGSTAGGTGSTAGGAVTPPAALTDTAKVIKTGSLDLEVASAGYEVTVDRIVSTAVGLGGYVAESSTSESDGAPSGSVVVRVPAAAFDQLVASVRKLGDVVSVATKGTDVTAQFTDLDARLTALTATRDRLYEVLRGARAIGDIIAVQDRITGVQTEIEQLQGQQRLLGDRAGFGTLSVTIGEPGRAIAATHRDEGLRHAFAVARHRFADSVEGFIAWSGSAALAVMIGLVLAILARLAWVRWRRRLI